MYARTRELDQVATALRRPDAVGVVLSGEAGVGKSTVLAGAASQAEAEGFAIVRLFGSRATSTLPLCVFSSLLAESSADESVERFATVRRALTDYRGNRPLLFAIDDVHLLDDASAVLISQLIRERSAFVLCSVRSGEPAPEPIAALWRQGSMAVCEVEPFDATATATIAAEMLGGSLHPTLEHELWTRSAGNPLFLRELILGSKASGAIAAADGVWRQQGTLETSDALGDLVTSHLEALSADEQHALCCVALSEPAGAGLLERVATDDALIALEEAGLIVVSHDRRRTIIRLTHPLYGEVIRARTSHLRARKIRRELAAAVEAYGARRRDDALAVATWRLESGDVDPQRFTAAARDAIRRYDVELAERLALAAHEHSPDANVTRTLVTARHLLGRPQEALDAIGPAIDAAEPGSDDWIRLRFLEGLVRFEGLGHYEDALEVLREVTAAAPTAGTRRRADIMIASAELLRGNPAESLALATSLRDNDPNDVSATAVYVKALAATGRPGTAASTSDAFIQRAGSGTSGLQFVDAHWFTLLDSGRIAECEAIVTQAWEQATDSGDRSLQLLAAFALGHLHHHRGQCATALRWIDTATAMAQLSSRAPGLGARALVLAQLGDIDGARAALSDLDAMTYFPALYFEVTAHRARGWVAVLGGEPTEGRASLTRLADDLIERKFLTQAVRVIVDLTRLGDATTASLRADAIHDAIDSPGLLTMLRFVRAIAADEPNELMAASDELATIEYAALAADAASAARDALARQGRQRDAGGCARKAAELIAKTEGGVTPLFAVVESVIPLTRREREIAVLVAAGRTSRGVAEACFLSVRTVETHLARIYDKLGINSRAELADALGPLMIGSAA